MNKSELYQEIIHAQIELRIYEQSKLAAADALEHGSGWVRFELKDGMVSIHHIPWDQVHQQLSEDAT